MATTSKKYSVRWKEPSFDVAELAKMRFIEGLDAGEISSRLGKPARRIGNFCRKLRCRGFKHRAIDAELREQLLRADAKKGAFE